MLFSFTHNSDDMFIATLLKIAKSWKQRNVSINGWMDKQCRIYVLWNIIQLQKKNEILIHAKTQINFTNIMISEARRKNVWFYLQEVPRVETEIHRDKCFINAIHVILKYLHYYKLLHLCPVISLSIIIFVTCMVL